MVNKLYEYLGNDRSGLIVVGEAADGINKNYTMAGIFVQAEIRNQNGRIYPLSEISKAVKTIKEKLQNGFSILGELDHPEELTINLDRVSHMIVDMWMEGNNGHGKLRIFSTTPMGKIAESLISNGVKLGISSRGSGNVLHDGRVSDYEMVTADLVAQPSAPDAFPRPIRECLYNMTGGGVVERMACDAASGDSLANKYLAKNILELIKELKK